MTATRIPLKFDSLPTLKARAKIIIAVAVGLEIVLIFAALLFTMALLVMSYAEITHMSGSANELLVLSLFSGGIVGLVFSFLGSFIKNFKEAIERRTFSHLLVGKLNNSQNVFTFTTEDSVELLRWHATFERSLNKILVQVRNKRTKFNRAPEVILFGTTYKELKSQTIKVDLYWSESNGFYLLTENLEEGQEPCLPFWKTIHFEISGKLKIGRS